MSTNVRSLRQMFSEREPQRIRAKPKRDEVTDILQDTAAISGPHRHHGDGERESGVVQVKPEQSHDVLCWNTLSFRGHNVGSSFLFTWKSHMSQGWMGEDRGEGGGKSGRITEVVPKRLLVSSPPFLQLHRCRKWTKQVEANLRRASITLLHGSPEGGDQCS